jgi:pyrroloquinoline quinone biosynthesis protein E
MGYYTNLITSGIGMDNARLDAFKTVGLDHIQISFQASSAELNDFIGGSRTFEHKLAIARQIKALGYPMVLNVVIHRLNIDKLSDILDLAVTLNADYVELANTQYYGWGLRNRALLLPTREQLQRAESVAHAYQERLQGRMKILYVVPDYYEERPKACMNGWGNVFLTIAPDGTALPCQAARQLPGLKFPNVRDASMDWIWNESPAFNRFRGFDWMKEPCRGCPERFKDFGGCRCQAFQLTGDAANADPVCSLSPYHDRVLATVAEANRDTPVEAPGEQSLVFRNARNARSIADPDNH